MSEESTIGSSRFLSLFGACLLGLATIASAWSGYQAAVWSGNSQVSFIKASNTLNEGNARFLLGVQMMMADGNMYLQASSQYLLGKGLEEPARLALAKGIESTMQKDFKKFVTWAKVQYKKTGKPHNPFDNPEYLLMRLGGAEAMRNKSNAIFKKGQEEGAFGDSYVLTVVFFSIVLFFAGMASVMRQRMLQITFLGAGTVTFLYTLIRLVTLPIA
ncbi:MAG: hypothetical protein EP343_02980 [Deltaproteobacteria bacterium]|nr:MAG: hypothetical protein EP343_02980 [Deltaproteobacteria bacterium]